MRLYWLKILYFLGSVSGGIAALGAQCSICTRTSAQQGPQAASGFNAAIIYLMLIPTIILVVMIIIFKKRANKL